MSARSRTIRIVLVVVLLVIIGGALWPVVAYFRAGHQFRAAEAALGRRDFTQASLHLEESLRLWPDDLLVRLTAARTARRQGDFARAIEHLQAFERARGSRAALVLEQQLLRVQSGDPTGAGALLAEYGNQPDSPEAGLVLEALIEGSLKAVQTAARLEGSTYGQLQLLDVTEARRLVDLWLAHRPAASDQVQGLVWRGLIHYHSKDFPQALADFRRALELAPDHLQARLFLAGFLMKESPQEAVAELRTLLARYPNDTQVQLELAALLHTLGQLDEASRLLDQVLASRPNDVPALVERARVALDLQQPAEAERWLRQALQVAPKDKDVNLTLSGCLRQAGRMEEAKQFQDRFQQLAAEEKRQLDEVVRLIQSTKRE